MEKLEKAVRGAGVLFLLAGVVWFLIGGYSNYSFTVGAKKQAEDQLVQMQRQNQNQQVVVNQMIGELRGLANADVERVLTKFMQPK